MNVKNIGSNQTEVVTSAGAVVLVSYSTPVAALVDGKHYCTAKKWGKTTSKHINKWLDGAVAQEKPQEFFDNL